MVMTYSLMNMHSFWTVLYVVTMYIVRLFFVIFQEYWSSYSIDDSAEFPF